MNSPNLVCHPGLKNLLALTFSIPEDYDLIREDDRIDRLNLAALRTGEPVTCSPRHADGTEGTLLLRRTLSPIQITWVKAGSALTLVV